MIIQAQIEAAAKALKECEYDCCDWDMNILREVAGIALTAAAEVGEQERHNAQVGRYVLLGNATIERCAQVVRDLYPFDDRYDKVVAVILALKDKP